MEYDLYTADDRRHARVIQPDVGESSSSSSYVGSDTSGAPGQSTADVVKAGTILPSGKPSGELKARLTGKGESRIPATGSGTGTEPAPQSSHGILMLPSRGRTSPTSGISQEQEEYHISEIGKHSSNIVTQGEGSTHESIQEGALTTQGQEESGDATNEALGPSDYGLGASTPSRDDDTHSAPRDDGELGSGMDIPNNSSGATEGTVPNVDIGRGSQMGSSRRTTLSTVSDTSVRRSPHLERTRSNSVHSDRNTREIVLPRWQPDAEVTYCPICRTQFSFFVRKHHCRRCGRVVCNACSPHRITIPYQFIVQPPPAVAAPSTESVSQSGPNTSSRVTGATSDFADRNGGMKVRLCNPCVPDPNPLPPQPQYSDMSGQLPMLYLNPGSRPYSFTEESTTGGSRRARGISAASVLRPSDQQLQQRSTSPYNRHTGSTTSYNASNSLYPNVQTGRYPGHMPRADPLRVQVYPSSSTGRNSPSPSHAYLSQSRGHASRHQSLSSIPGGSNPNPQPHYRSLLDIGSDQYTRTSSSSDRPLPPIPHVNEEDECPVCHRVLFSRTLPDFENLRAAHIIQCIDEQIALHSGNSSRPGAYTSQSQPAPTSTATDLSPPPPTEPPAPQPQLSIPALPSTPLANTPEARAAARERAHAAVVLGTTSSASSTPPRRRTGMFVYRASEKDCVDEAECTICLEEFEVGASMARLECFCRFHKTCIQGWFVDHPGRCPVHQHDGYGF